MTKIETREQYEWAVTRVEQLLPLVDDKTPRTDPNIIELELLSNLVADYSEENFSIGKPSLEILELLVFVDLLAVGNIKPAAFLSVSPIQAVSETKMAQPKMSG